MNQSITAYLDQGVELSMLSMNTSRHWVDENTLPEWYTRLKHFRTVFVKTDINPLSAFLNLFSEKSYNVSRFVHREYEAELIRLLQQEEFDYIQFESIYTSPYLKTVRKYSEAKCICRVHNIEHHIWQRLSEHEPSFLKRKYLELLTSRLRNYELDILKHFDVLLPISPQECKELEALQLNRCYHLPFGVEESEVVVVPSERFATCFHIGSMDWAPNVEGVHWFLDQVWELIHHQFPELHLTLAGKKMPPSIHADKEKNIEVPGEIDDLNSFYHQHNIMVVPLQSGAGVRIKILEAMARGKVIVSTPLGAEGLGVQHQEHLLLAEQPETFCEQFSWLMTHREEAIAMGLRGRTYVNETFCTRKLYTRWIADLETGW